MSSKRLLLDYCRDELGLLMGGIQGGSHCGWTTDADVAEKAREAGAKVTVYAPAAPVTPGYDISFPIGKEATL